MFHLVWRFSAASFRLKWNSVDATTSASFVYLKISFLIWFTFFPSFCVLALLANNWGRNWVRNKVKWTHFRCFFCCHLSATGAILELFRKNLLRSYSQKHYFQRKRRKKKTFDCLRNSTGDAIANNVRIIHVSFYPHIMCYWQHRIVIQSILLNCRWHLKLMNNFVFIVEWVLKWVAFNQNSF